MATYDPTVFDKAFTKVVNVLKNEDIIPLNKLAEKLTLDPAVLSNIIKGNRGVPKHKIELIITILTGVEFNVRSLFLKTGTGEMFKEAPRLKEEISLLASFRKENEQLKKTNEELMERITYLEESMTELKKYSDLQSQLIQTLQNRNV